MSLDAVAKPPTALESGRFFRVGYLPTYALLIFLLILVWAGAPRDHLSFKEAWQTASELGAAEIVLIALVIVVAAIVWLPLQLPLLRALEGGWPSWLGAGLLRRWQLRQRNRLIVAAALVQPPGVPTEDQIRLAGIAGSRLRQRYPLADHLIQPTALGNVLAAMQDTAGRAYGIDVAVAWPRLYLVLGDQTRTIVDDRRDSLDSAGSMAASAAVATVGSSILLWNVPGNWWLLTIIPALISVISYGNAVRAAAAYSEAVQVAVDMHRFDMLTALKVQLPLTRSAEVRVNRELCDHWRQGIPMSLPYSHASQA